MRTAHGRYKWINRYLHYVLGGAISILAAVAALVALQDAHPTLTAILAGVASVLSAIQLFLKPTQRTSFHLLQEIGYDELVRDVADARARTGQSPDQIRESVDALQERYYALRRKAVEGSSE